MRTTTVLNSEELDSLARLGQTLKLARLRRDLSQQQLADRMGVARPSVVALEAGKPGVGIGILLKALTILGYTSRLGELLANDPIGDDMDIARRHGVGNRRHVADF